MENENKSLLEEEIKREIDLLSKLNPGTEEHTTATDNLNILYKLKIEEIKNEREISEAEKARESELELKRAQLSEQIKERNFRLGVDVFGIIAPLVFYGIWMRRGFKFEETGAYTSKTFMNLFNRFRPSKN